MKIGVGQIIFMRAGAHQRMDYCWRTFEGDRKGPYNDTEPSRATARVPASPLHHPRPYNDTEGFANGIN